MKKKMFITALILASMLSISACESDKAAEASKPLSDITADVVSCGVEFPEMIEVTEENFQLKYNLTSDDYDSFSLRWAGSGADADEVCIIKAKNTGKVKDALKDRIDSQKNTFKDYAPEQYDKLCDSKVKTKGDYIYWMCTNDNKKSEKALEDDFS